MEPSPITFEHDRTHSAEQNASQSTRLGEHANLLRREANNLPLDLSAAPNVDVAFLTVDSPRDRFTFHVQRAIDIACSAVGLLFIFPLTLLVAVAIKLDSPGPILFKQQRIGYRGGAFKLFKFRSMTVDAELRQAELWSENEREGPVFKIRKDPRVTRVGRFLRRYSLDELPQLLNVLHGDMSLVGPRPALPLEVEMYSPKQMQRLSVVPGITGLWQISGRANLSFDESVDLDLTYIRTRSIWLNFWIILRTLPAVIRGEGAY